MKKFLSILLLSIAVSCNTAEDKTATHDSTNTASTGNVTYVSPITYSSDFEMGNSEHAQTIVQLWKDFDDNNIDNGKQHFADTLVMEFPGMTMRGTRDSMTNMTKAYRSEYSSMSSVIEAVLPIRAKNRNEDWVAIWGMETSTKNGKTDSTGIHEIWRFNKDGKIDYMSQFIQPKGAMQ